jgi:hypothetical protein
MFFDILFSCVSRELVVGHSPFRGVLLCMIPNGLNAKKKRKAVLVTGLGGL